MLSNRNLIHNFVFNSFVLCSVAGWLCVCNLDVLAQEASAERDNIDAPRTIDPATLIPPNLAIKSSVDLSNSSLREMVNWLQTEHKLVVLLDKNELARIRISPAEPIDDRLLEAPIYLLLDRLSILDIDWFFEDEILYITSAEAAESRLRTLSYNVGDLLDRGYDLDNLERVIIETIAPDSWLAAGGVGVVSTLGDVLFVRQSDDLQRQVEALLVALQNHGQQTFVNDPSEHFQLREALQRNVSLDVVETPLESAISQLAENAETDIRLDRKSLRLLGVREREPVTAQLADRKLATVLQALVLDLEMTWILRDGVLWITSEDEASDSLKTCVYNVRDLCDNEVKTKALVEAIVAQAEPDSWFEAGGYGSIAMARAGTIVVTQQEQIHQEVLDLLGAFRSALQSSKPRENAVDRMQEIVTVYYRLHSNVAEDLAKLLPQIVAPGTWKDESNPDGKAELFVVSSVPDLPAETRSRSDPLGASKQETPNTSGPNTEIPTYIDRAVIIVRQTRPVHEEIQEVISRVQTGDNFGASAPVSAGAIGGMGGMFRIPIGNSKSDAH